MTQPTSNSDRAEVGELLREARERLGLSTEDIAHRLRLQNTIIVALEKGEYRLLGAPIYIRGFLRSYAREVGLTADLLLPAARSLQDEEPVVTAPIMPVRNRWIERYSLVASYLVGTGLLLSALWWVVHTDGFDLARSPAPNLTVDPPDIASAPVLPEGNEAALGFEPLPSTTDGLAFQPLPPLAQTAGAAPLTPAAPENPDPITASLVPNLAKPGAIALTVQTDSWVEIIDGNGKRLKFDIQKAGREEYVGTPPYSLTIGNASQAELRAGGRTIALSEYSKREVARLRLEIVDGVLRAAEPPKRAARTNAEE